MNIALFTRGMSLLGKPRASQTVHTLTTTFGGTDRFGLKAEPRHIVLVTPHGSESGQYFEVSDKGRENLIGGSTPEYLGLEPCEPTDDDHDEIEREFDRRYAERSRP